MNFCTEALGTRIEVVGRVSEEGYEVSNLLKTKTLAQSPMLTLEGTGFMASRFVRPPVKIRLDFPTPIHISHIVLGPKLGQQISSGFKIEVDINSDGRGENLHQIGREFLYGPQFSSIVVFRNPRFILHRKYCHLPLGEFEAYRNFPNAFGLRHPTYNSCERIFSLYLTIEKAEAPARIPVLGSLQVWGQPSKWSTFAEVQKLLSIWLESGRLLISAQMEKPNEAEGKEPETKRRKVCDSTVLPAGIPEEFLDPITFEVLCQPLRLPCGVAIDSKTLERYSKEEAKWGRCENDPFTGKIFTEDSRPLPDLSLKGRIDAFLTQHSNEFQVPRTLGSKPKEPSNVALQSSRIVEILTNHPLPSASVPETSVCQTGESSIQLTPKEFMEQELARILSDSPSFKPPTPSDPPLRLQQCFKCFQHVSASSINKRTELELFYKSACNHIIVCRKCLMTLKRLENNTCASCNSLWSPNTLTKICV